MDTDFDSNDSDIERRIEGEFMRRLQESEVPFEITESMESLLDEKDLGGKAKIIELIEEQMLDNEN